MEVEGREERVELTKRRAREEEKVEKRETKEKRNG